MTDPRNSVRSERDLIIITRIQPPMVQVRRTKLYLDSKIAFGLPCIASLRGYDLMVRIFKGVGVGTFLHSNDLRVTGISSRKPGASPSDISLMSHVARGTTTSPYVSLTRSFGVAPDYAISASAALPTATRPAYVYAIDIDETHKLRVLDPVCEIARMCSDALAPMSYHHDGSQSFL